LAYKKISLKDERLILATRRKARSREGRWRAPTTDLCAGQNFATTTLLLSSTRNSSSSSYHTYQIGNTRSLLPVDEMTVSSRHRRRLPSAGRNKIWRQKCAVAAYLPAKNT